MEIGRRHLARRMSASRAVAHLDGEWDGRLWVRRLEYHAEGVETTMAATSRPQRLCEGRRRPVFPAQRWTRIRRGKRRCCRVAEGNHCECFAADFASCL